MGTRALIHIKDTNLESPTLVTIYRQYDGYISGLGCDIARILNMGHSKVINGIEQSAEMPEYFNGMQCLAPYLIGQLKERIGNVYIYPPDTSNVWEDFTYTLYQSDEGLLTLQVETSRMAGTSTVNEVVEHAPLFEFVDYNK